MRAICPILAMAAATSAVMAGEEIGKPDLSSPKSVVLAFRDAISRRDWLAAERCLASDLRKMLKDAIADRTFFDQYVVNGFSTKTIGFLPAHLVTDKGMAELERLERPSRLDGPPGPLPDRLVHTIGSGGGACPWIAQCALVKESDGWKLSPHPQLTKKEHFLAWYERAIAEHARGQARALEGKPVEPALAPSPKSGGVAPPVRSGFPGK